ncbi:MAG: hypothetical protein ACI9DF_006006 [Verrucomicrobiales bacterium]|jgi:hypothetical protein
MSEHSLVQELFDPVGDCLTSDVAARLLELRAPEAVQDRMESYAAKSSQGLLSPNERDEYDALIATGRFIALLQAKARCVLKEAS